jgi:hypothetical protein
VSYSVEEPVIGRISSERNKWQLARQPLLLTYPEAGSFRPPESVTPISAKWQEMATLPALARHNLTLEDGEEKHVRKRITEKQVRKAYHFKHFR